MVVLCFIGLDKVHLSFYMSYMLLLDGRIPSRPARLNRLTTLVSQLLLFLQARNT